MTVLFVFASLIILPAAAAYLSHTSLFSRAAFGIGAPVVYQWQEMSSHPGPDAHDVRPSQKGEYYYYYLINYLRVTEVLADGRVIAVARDNKRICFWPNDSQVRKARLTERLIHRWRFPSVAAV
jgi:hypothetical protein